MAYSSIGHVGYILISYSTGTIEGVQMIYFYIIVYMISSFGLWSFLVLLKRKHRYVATSSKTLADFSALFNSNKMIAIILATIILSIAGVPPLIGFLAKAGIFLSAIESSMYFVAIISILCSVISTFFYLRLIKVMYFLNFQAPT